MNGPKTFANIDFQTASNKMQMMKTALPIPELLIY